MKAKKLPGLTRVYPSNFGSQVTRRFPKRLSISKLCCIQFLKSENLLSLIKYIAKYINFYNINKWY
jgi:hypothetical protein